MIKSLLIEALTLCLLQPIVYIPFQDKSQMLVGVTGFFAQCKMGINRILSSFLMLIFSCSVQDIKWKPKMWIQI